jgi:PilZ domain.
MKVYSIQRAEKRIPMDVAVQIAGNGSIPGMEMTFTEDVSRRGARVLTARRWKTNDRLHIASLAGNFQSTARVAYCQPLHSGGFAVGLELAQPTGHWVVDPASEPGPAAA